VMNGDIYETTCTLNVAYIFSWKFVMIWLSGALKSVHLNVSKVSLV